jgi:hypothetical protein
LLSWRLKIFLALLVFSKHSITSLKIGTFLANAGVYIEGGVFDTPGKYNFTVPSGVPGSSSPLSFLSVLPYFLSVF